MDNLSSWHKQQIREIHQKHRALRTTIFENIPFKKLEIARNKWKLLKGEDIILHFDSGVFGGGQTGILMTDKNLYYHNLIGTTDIMNYKDIKKITFSWLYLFVHMKNGSVVTIEILMGRGRLFRTVRDIVELLKQNNLKIEEQNNIRSAGRCLGCGAGLDTSDKSCPYCRRQLDTYVERKQRTVRSTVLKTIAILLFLLLWFGLAAWFLILPIIDIGFETDARDAIRNLFSSNEFVIDYEFFPNVVTLESMEINIDSQENWTLTNRMNFYNGLPIFVFDGSIYRGSVEKIIRYEPNFATTRVVMTLNPSYIADSNTLQNFAIREKVLYYVLGNGIFNQVAITSDGSYQQSRMISTDIHMPYFETHRNRMHYRTSSYLVSDISGGTLYIGDTNNGNYQTWIGWGEIYEIFPNFANDHKIIADGSAIRQINFSDGHPGPSTTSTIATNFRPNRDNGYGAIAMTTEKLYWIGPNDRIYSYDFSTENRRRIGRIEDVRRLNIINDELLVITHHGNLYLLDTGNRSGRLLARDVSGVAVVGNYMIFDRMHSQTLYVMDLDGNVAVLNEQN